MRRNATFNRDGRFSVRWSRPLEPKRYRWFLYGAKRPVWGYAWTFRGAERAAILAREQYPVQ